MTSIFARMSISRMFFLRISPMQTCTACWFSPKCLGFAHGCSVLSDLRAHPTLRPIGSMPCRLELYRKRFDTEPFLELVRIRVEFRGKDSAPERLVEERTQVPCCYLFRSELCLNSGRLSGARRLTLCSLLAVGASHLLIDASHLVITDDWHSAILSTISRVTFNITFGNRFVYIARSQRRVILYYI